MVGDELKGVDEDMATMVDPVSDEVAYVDGRFSVKQPVSMYMQGLKQMHPLPSLFTSEIYNLYGMSYIGVWYINHYRGYLPTDKLPLTTELLMLTLLLIIVCTKKFCSSQPFISIDSSSNFK